MPKVSARISPYVCARFSRWLRRSLDDSGLSHGQVARASQVGTSAIAGYLGGSRVPTPATAFRIGQGLALAVFAPGEEYAPRPGGEAFPSFDPRNPQYRPPAPGGLMALFAAGFFADALSITVALLESERDDCRAYAVRFASVCWLANADLDNVDEQKTTRESRDAMRLFIGDAPVDALEVVWPDRHKFGILERALLDVGFDARRNTPTETGGESIYYGAVLAWRTLTGEIALRAKHDAFLAASWKYTQNGFEKYWGEVVLA